MRIQFASDLHLEFKENLAYVQSIPFDVTGEILILAGDTFYLKDRTMPNIKFWRWASQNYQQVILVPGNHEFYNNGDMTARGASWQYMFLDNVGYYYNKVICIGDLDIILSTLWSHIGAENEVSVYYSPKIRPVVKSRSLLLLHLKTGKNYGKQEEIQFGVQGESRYRGSERKGDFGGVGTPVRGVTGDDQPVERGVREALARRF